MKLKGWLRLWVVLSAVGVPLASMLSFHSQQKWWHDNDEVIMKLCVDEEIDNPKHSDALECGRQSGVLKSFYERENITPGLYWSESLGLFFILDCIITAFLIGAFFVVRWIIVGFKEPIAD